MDNSNNIDDLQIDSNCTVKVDDMPVKTALRIGFTFYFVLTAGYIIFKAAQFIANWIKANAEGIKAGVACILGLFILSLIIGTMVDSRSQARKRTRSKRNDLKSTKKGSEDSTINKQTIFISIDGQQTITINE